MYMSSLVAQMVKICLQCRKPRFNPWVRKIFWRREWLLTAVFFPDGYLLQYSCLENSMDRGAWQATVHGVAKSQRLNKWCSIKISMNSGCLGGSDGQKSACNAGDPGSSPGWGRSPGEGNGYPLLYSCLENSMDRGAWQATAHGVTRSQT